MYMYMYMCLLKIPKIGNITYYIYIYIYINIYNTEINDKGYYFLRLRVQE